jgi:uncharacterized damage-inducible protein DinB
VDHGRSVDVVSSADVLQPFYAGWADHQRLVLAAIGDLDEDQMALRTAPGQMAVWQIASHMAGSRAYWFHDVLGEGDPAVRDMFRVAATTVPNVSLENAGWEDDESRPRSAAEIADAFHRTWGVIEDCLSRWTPDDLARGFTRGAAYATSRSWVIWHLMEHEAHHGGAISLILGTNGLTGIDV